MPKIRACLVALFASLASLALLLPSSAGAFSVRLHIYLANSIHDNLAMSHRASGRYAIRLMRPDNTDARWVELPERSGRALLGRTTIVDASGLRRTVDNIEFFRGGAIGPDNTVVPGLTDPSHGWIVNTDAFGSFPFGQCDALLMAAENREQTQLDAGVRESDLDLSERAYALGCFLHGISDNAAHHLVNYFTGETFTLYPLDAAQGGHLRWSALNVVRHIASESRMQDAWRAHDARIADRDRPGITSRPADERSFDHRIAVDLVLRVYYGQRGDDSIWPDMARALVAEKTEHMCRAIAAITTGETGAPAPRCPIDNAPNPFARLGSSDQPWEDDKRAVRAYIDFLQHGGNFVPDEFREAPAPADYILLFPSILEDVKALYQTINAQGRNLASGPDVSVFLHPIEAAKLGMLRRMFLPDGGGPSRFDRLMQEKFEDIDRVMRGFVFTIERLSNLNITTGLVRASPAQLEEALRPFGEALEHVTPTSDEYLMLLLGTEAFSVLRDYLEPLLTTLRGLYNVIRDGIAEYVLGTIRRALTSLRAQFQVLIEAALRHVDAQLLDAYTALRQAVDDVRDEAERAALRVALGLDLPGSGPFDRFLDSVLWMNAYNSAVAVIGEPQIVAPRLEGLFEGPYSFDASYQLEYNQLSVCTDSAPLFYPCGRSATEMLQSDYRHCRPFPPALRRNPPIECRDPGSIEFSSSPSTVSCRPARLAEVAGDRENRPTGGSYTLAFPPSPEILDGAYDYEQGIDRRPPYCERSIVVQTLTERTCPDCKSGDGFRVQQPGNLFACALTQRSSRPARGGERVMLILVGVLVGSRCLRRQFAPSA